MLLLPLFYIIYYILHYYSFVLLISSRSFHLTPLKNSLVLFYSCVVFLHVIDYTWFTFPNSIMKNFKHGKIEIISQWTLYALHSYSTINILLCWFDHISIDPSVCQSIYFLMQLKFIADIGTLRIKYFAAYISLNRVQYLFRSLSTEILNVHLLSFNQCLYLHTLNPYQDIRPLPSPPKSFMPLPVILCFWTLGGSFFWIFS